MNKTKIKELKLKAHRYAKEEKLNKREERRAYKVLKKMYQEATIKERQKIGL